MPVFVEDPAQFSKSRLRSDLIAHNVSLPRAESKKEVYVELYLKHIDQKKAADFSSDEEDEVQDVAEKDKEDPEMLDPSGLTDDELKATLFKHGVKAGPIVASTRALYERRLKKLLQANAQQSLKGAGDAALYSDSEEEEEEDEEEDEDEESGSEQARQETVSQLEQTQQESSQAELHLRNGGYVYHQCFLPSSRLHACDPRHWEPSPKRNAGNVVKSSTEWSQAHCSQIPTGLSRTSSVAQPTGLESGVPSASHSVMFHGSTSSSSQTFSIAQMVEEMESRRSLSSSADKERGLNGSNVQEHWLQSNRLDMPKVDQYTAKDQSVFYTPKPSPYKLEIKLPQEPVMDILKEMFPDTVPTPTGICATRRRPIKGAAGRPVPYKYPETPVSPMTLERQEVERRLVPIQIQILVFLIVTCLLYLIYVYVEDNSYNPFVALLDNLNLGSDSEEGPLLQVGTEDTPVPDPLSAQE